MNNNFISEVSIEDAIADDPGIDFLNYSLEEEIKKYNDILEVAGYDILVRVYVPPKVEKIGGIFLSDETQQKLRQDSKFTNLTGLVIKFSRAAYKDTDRYKLTGPYCKIGDWIQFPRASGYSFAHNKMTSLYLTEDMPKSVIKDPRTITRIT